MSRFKKFLYAYFSIILALIVLSILGVETWSDKTPIELFFTEWKCFVGLTLAVFVTSLFL